MPGWDNTARRGKHAHVFAGSTPERYGKWLLRVAQEVADQPGDGDRFVFINAWNEWAEGATLEPSRQYGRTYLEATRAALEQVRIDSDVEAAERRLSRRLATLDRRLAGSSAQTEEGFVDVRENLAEQRSLLDALRQDLERFGQTAAGHRLVLDQHETALSWLNDVRMQASAEWSRQLYELRSLLDGRRRARDLWLGMSCGWAGLLLKGPLWLLSGRPVRRFGWWREARRICRRGLFDPDFYRERYPEVAAEGVDPLYHYVRYGVAEGRVPNPYLLEGRGNAVDAPEITEVPSEAPADTGDLGIPETPAVEQVVPEAEAEPMADAVLAEELLPEAETVDWTLNRKQSAKGATAIAWLFVSHDAARAGSQIYLLELLRSFSSLPEVELYLLLRRGGDLRHEFERYAHVLDLEEVRSPGATETSAVLDAVRAMVRPPAVALCNTVASGLVASILHDLGIPIVAIVHELPTTIGVLGERALRDTIASAERVILVSHFVKNALIERFGLAADRLEVIHAGATGLWRPGCDGRESSRWEVFAKYGLPDDTTLVLGCGAIHHRKGTDLFVQVARSAILDHGLERLRFLWAGADEDGPLFRSWCEHDLAAFGLRDRVVFTGPQSSTVDLYQAADVFLLTSREDPFPLVNLEAMARGLPVIAFEGAGGACEALEGGAGVLVPYLDIAEMTRALVRLVEAPRYRDAIREAALSRIDERFRWDRFAGELREILVHCAGGEADRRAPAPGS